ncbi:MAG: response regulator, partial [Acidaminobacteraceae bacterium]
MNLLIVDDSKMIRMMSRDILVNNNIDANILSCESGYLAFDMLKDNNIDVILLDIVMPSYTGIEVLKDLKEGGYLDKIRVLMFSSLSDKFALKECFELGAFDYILKPLEPIEFISRVSNALTDQRLRIELSKSLEEKTNQNKQLEDLNLKLKETQAELIHKEQMAGIGRLAAGIAHEINNPLGFISSNIETLKEYSITFKIIEELFKHIIDNS